MTVESNETRQRRHRDSMPGLVLHPDKPV